jgi:lipopolysaccharide export LptBFGC system permease protein LptF
MWVFVVAMLVAAVAFGLSQRRGAREWLGYQALGAGSILVSGVVGTVGQEGFLRYAFLVLVVAAIARLIYLPKQARARTS